MNRHQGSKSKLSELKNVGKATLEDLRLLGIYTIEDLALQNPTELYHRLEKIIGKQQDFCVWDVFAAIIHEAKTGDASPWWDWTPKRKALQKAGNLSHFEIDDE